MDNIIYFSGCHGSGKTTLIHIASARYPDRFVRHRKLDIPKNYSTYERTLIRSARSYLQVYDQRNLSIENPDKFILCDRCIYDQEAYMNGFLNLNWVNQREYQEFTSLIGSMFNGHLPKNIVFLNPTLEEAILNIKNRWKYRKPKYREENFTYLEAVIEGYRERFANIDILKIETIDLDRRVDMLMNWVNKLN